MNSIYTYWIIFILMFLSISNLHAQVRISISGYSITSNFTDFSNSYVTINSPISEVNEPVNLIFYDGRYIDENNILMRSQEFYLQSGLSKLAVSEILASSKISSKSRKSKYITIVLSHFNSGVQKGLTTITTLNNTNEKENSSLSSLIRMEGELSLASRRAKGSLVVYPVSF